MTTTELVRMPVALDRPASAAEIRAQVNLIQEVMKAVMKDGIHYGTIPGTPKPTLYKAGSEQLLSTFHIAIEPIITDLSTPDEARFRVEARATLQATGTYLGSGIGEASSHEEKYKWRKAVCEPEFDETPEDRRRKVWKKGRGDQDAYQIAQVRTHPADVANTILKMAKKRAQIDVTLTVTAASDVFAQDIEDLPDELREAVADERPAGRQPIQPPQRKATKPPNGQAPAGAGTVVRLQVSGFGPPKTGTSDKGPWTKWFIKGDDGRVYGTFSESDRQAAEHAKQHGLSVEITYKEGKYGPEIQALTVLEAPREPGEDA